MNYLHGPYIKSGQITNADLLYTLACSFLEPIRLIRLFEWRALNDMEVAALGTFWKALGDAMHIEYKGYLAKESWRDGIEFVEDVAAWARQYEVDCMKPDAINVGPSRALTGMLTHLVPGSIKPLVLEVVCVLIGQRLREAFLCVSCNQYHTYLAGLPAERLTGRRLATPNHPRLQDSSHTRSCWAASCSCAISCSRASCPSPTSSATRPRV